jgi:class 3 adenylate cyclase
LLISDATYARAKDVIVAEASGEIHVKGREQPVRIYQVAGLNTTVSG